MAERRMFAKTIIDSDAFLDMPLSAQALYFHLSMRADDEGFINNPKKIQRMIGGSDDDLKLLILKNFIIPFESGIVVIKHWKIHNYIRNDRKKETVYPEEMSLLEVKDNGAYTLRTHQAMQIECVEVENTPRQIAYRESNLPYSFEYKIKRAFEGRNCPICNAKMQIGFEDGIKTTNRIPTIQHNIPISMGGRHELGNVSVICKECNITLQDTPTDKLNADEVVEEWDKICMSDNCLSSGSQMSAQVRLGKDRIGKVRLGEDSIGEEIIDSDESLPPKKAKQTKHKYGEYNNVLLTDEELDKLKTEYSDWEERIERLSSYVASTGKSYKSHYATIRNWARKDAEVKPAQFRQNKAEELNNFYAMASAWAEGGE